MTDEELLNFKKDDYCELVCEFVQRNGYCTEQCDSFREHKAFVRGYNYASEKIRKEKVVEELEKIKRYNLSLGDAVCDIQENGVNRHFVCLEDVIEIVKRGVK